MGERGVATRILTPSMEPDIKIFIYLIDIKIFLFISLFIVRCSFILSIMQGR